MIGIERQGERERGICLCVVNTARLSLKHLKSQTDLDWKEREGERGKEMVEL